MITKAELATLAQVKHLSIRNTERDYLLELILYATSEEKQSLVFKGGTALYKFYNLNRFSEDLDFDIVGKKFDVETLIKKVRRNLEVTGMQRTLHEETEHGNEINIRFLARGPLYDGSKPSMSRVSLNLSRRERPQNVHKKFLIPSYQELPSFDLTVLDAEEIAAEKIRCILTREKPRDIYDLWFLSKRGIALERRLVEKKLRVYRSTFDVVLFQKKLVEKRHMWRRDLEGLVIGTLPPFDTVLAELQPWIDTLR